MAKDRPTSAAARSLWVGLGHLLRRPATTCARGAPSGLRVTGMPRLVPDAAGGSLCVACHLCVAACPARCIAVEAGLGEIAPGQEGRARRTVAVFTIDTARCVFCGLCAEACPEQALAMSRDRLGPGGLPLCRHARPAQRFGLEVLIRAD